MVEAEDIFASPASLPRRKRVLFSVASAVLGLLLGLLIIEVSLRIFLVRRAEFFDRVHEQVSREWGGELTLFDIIRPASTLSRVYEMIPGANGIFVGQPLLINREGFRDVDHPNPKPAGTVRVAVLGDSIAFGWGVRQQDRFSAVMSPMLGTSNTEVLNFGVPGYNTVMELATFEEKVLACSPDVLVLSMVENDDELPNFVRLRPRAWSLDRCFIVETIRDQLVGRKLGDTARLAFGGIAEAGGVGHAHDAVGFRPELVPPEYRFLVGEKAMVDALQRLANEARQHGIVPICVAHRSFEKPTAEQPGVLGSARLVQYAGAAGYEVVDAGEAILTYLQHERLGEKSLWINENDFHPNATGHRVIAEALSPVLRKVIERVARERELK